MAPLLDVQQLSLQFAGRTILKQLSLTVAAGTVVSVLGSNGAGKSTLLKAVMGLHDQGSQQSGLIRIDGHDLIDGRNFAQARQQALSKLAYVPELPAVYPHLSAIENIRYFLGVAGVPETAAVESCLQRTGLDSEAWHRPCQTYSKGMKQKVMLAFALAKQAKLLLLDEPNSGLDPHATAELNQLILECKALGMGVLVVTHDVISAITFSDQLFMLHEGQLQPISVDPAQLNLETLRQLYLGQVS